VGQIAYHFGKKETLVRETIRRRAGGVERRAASRCWSSTRNWSARHGVEVEPLVRALILPYYNKLDGDDEQWRHFATFVGPLCVGRHAVRSHERKLR
jgi:AcrR family transcriptional regulator